MDIITAYGLVGSYRGAAEICGMTPRTVKKVVTEELARMSGQPLPEPKARVSNTEVVRYLVDRKVTASKVSISAKRLLRPARAAGYEGSTRNLRRLTAQAGNFHVGKPGTSKWSLTVHQPRILAECCLGECVIPQHFGCGSLGSLLAQHVYYWN